MRLVRRFIRTPKGVLTIVLSLLTLVAAPGQGVAQVAPGLLSAMAVAVLIDAPIRWRQRGRWGVPTGALLTGWLVALVLSPHEPWYITASTSAAAVLGKSLIRARRTHIFNPAALAIVLTFYVFDTGQNWWGALTGITPGVAVALLIVTGLFITDRVNRIPLVLAFFGAYYLLLTANALIGDPEQVVEAFVAPDLQATLFFAFFMLTDPPTSPTRYSDQVVCGVVVAATSYGFFMTVSTAPFLPAAVLAGNLITAGQRWHRSASRTVYN